MTVISFGRTPMQGTTLPIIPIKGAGEKRSRAGKVRGGVEVFGSIRDEGRA
ncbi:hypothetical protein ABCW43_21610 [Neorhizobium sp. IRAMC:178]|uniref:hypothetical protein n=1 Tax=Neorhizobium tunisiense TaxID=3144793 RepID=UPI0031F6233A